MAIAALSGHVFIPRPFVVSGSTAPNFTTTFSMTGATHKAAMLVEVPKTGNIRKVHFGTRTVTTGATVDVRIETLDRTTTPVVPSGTLWGTNTNASQVIANADDNVMFTTTLTADAAVTRGDQIFVVIANAGAGNMQISGMGATVLAGDGGVASSFRTLFGGASWVATQSGLVLALEYDDGSYYPILGCYAVSAITTTTFSNSSTPDCIGERFQLPVPSRCSGFWLLLDADGDVVVRLVTTAYHQANATGILASKTIKKEDRAANAGAYQEYYWETDSVELSASTNYRWIVEPSSATSLTIYDMSFNSLALMATRDGGSNWHLTTAKDPTADGSWTNYNSGTFRRLFGGLMFDGFDAGGGGSGGGPLIGGRLAI